eukprot:gene8774-722_t
MSFIKRNLQKSKRRSLGHQHDIPTIQRKSSSDSITSEDNISQASTDSKKKKKTRRLSTELPHLDSFKSMFSLGSPRSTGSRSPRGGSGGRKSPVSSDSKSHGSRSPTTVMGRMKQLATITKEKIQKNDHYIQEEPKEEEEIFNFELALTIIGSTKNQKKFQEVFAFLHRLDALETFDEDEEDEEENEQKKKKKLGLLHEINVRSRMESTKIQISNITNSEQLHILSTKYASIKNHSFIILCDESTDDYMKTWFDIIESNGLTGNVVLLFDEENEGDGLEDLMKAMENQVSDIFIEAYVKSLSVDYSNVDLRLEQIEDCIQKSIM